MKKDLRRTFRILGTNITDLKGVLDMAAETRWTLEKTLDLALNMEEQSIRLYTSAQVKAFSPGSKQILKKLVKEERKHKNKILEAQKNPEKVEKIGLSDTNIDDLKIVDFLEDVTLSPDAGYQQILIYAGKREKTAHDFYIWLAKQYPNNNIGTVFTGLAQEELKHKYMLEREYDDLILKQM
jgi:rubrerythrin